MTMTKAATTALLAMLMLAVNPATGQNPANLQPRQPLTGMTGRELVQPADRPVELHVKFIDAAKVRADANGPVSRTGMDVTPLSQVLDAHQAQLQPLITLPEQTLQSIELRAAQRSRRAQPDLGSMMRVTVDVDVMADVARALQALPIVEWVWLERLQPPPPCQDIAPMTPLYRSNQLYFQPNPGLAMQCAKVAWNADGSGVRVADCEYGLNVNHEDLCNIVMEPGQTIAPGVFSNGWDRHGTAVAGMLHGVDNGYGVTGLAPNAELHFFSEWTVQEGFRRTDCIASAVAALDAGDVLLLEMQAFGPGNVLAPAEYTLSVWTLTKTATDAGIIVVAAAGNGGTDLDAPQFESYLDRGDSGAIIVGGGSASTAHVRMSTSNYGSRVNVQGWGQSVFTSGYGSFAQIGGDPNQRYTATFNGTSSAAAMVAGACAAMQSAVLQVADSMLTPIQLRDVLMATGHPQMGTQHIGPFPDVVAALQAVGLEWSDCLGNGRPNACDIDSGLADDVNGNGVPDACDAWGDLDGDGRVSVFDLLILLEQWGPCPPGCSTGCPADLLAPDCTVDYLDLIELLANWG